MAPITKIISLLSSASLINAIVMPESVLEFPVAHDEHASVYDKNSPLPSIFNLTLSGKTRRSTKSSSDDDDTPLPLIIWHGLGDNYKADGLAQVGKLAEAIHPGTFVYNIHVDEDASADRTATFFGNLTREYIPYFSFKYHTNSLTKFKSKRSAKTSPPILFSLPRPPSTQLDSPKAANSCVVTYPAAMLHPSALS